ncbi:hypothetical protein [Paenibacillus sp. 481]|uniref:hypothetical protein n=1 Tax=Paenibacillus sp. 481 TaxID=2835869 RepID=UPI001E4B277F|nr:hypothetical protein [Paenibacillus sp. 481]UHA71932.1 hypothetical protein KIK04_14460 [Paenibacillus sp. 481]
MIQYRDYVRLWLEPMAKDLRLPLHPADAAVGTPAAAPRILYDLRMPYVDCTPNHAEMNGPLTKIVEMEWLLMVDAADKLEAVERTRHILGWLWTTGTDQLATLGAVLVRVKAPQWRKEPVACLGIRVRLRTRDRFERTLVSPIDKAPITMKE